MRGERILPAGRHWMGRLKDKGNRCPSCDARMMYGHPSPNSPWERLRLSPIEVKLLLHAASEFDVFAASHEDRPTAVEFVDWLSPDVLGKQVDRKDYDGIAEPRDWRQTA